MEEVQTSVDKKKKSKQTKKFEPSAPQPSPVALSSVDLQIDADGPDIYNDRDWMKQPKRGIHTFFHSLSERGICTNPYAISAEFIGTLIFLFATTLGVTYSGGQLINIATGYGITLGTVIYITAPISGGHINPAVTLAIAVSGEIKWSMAGAYIISQMLGAIVGVAIADWVSDDLIGSIFVNEKASVVSGFLGETVGTWFLVLTVFATAVQSSKGEQTPAKAALAAQAPMIIGWSVWAMHFAIVGVTGCGINPARFIGTAIVLNKFDPYAWIYFFGPFAGALLAVPTQALLFKPEKPVTNMFAADAMA